MESKAKLAGHPIHQMLIVFPLGLFATAVIFDLVGLATHQERWSGASFIMIAAGIIGGLAAAIFGFIDWFAIPRGTRASRIGLLHGLGNVVIVAMFTTSWLLRRPLPEAPSTAAVVLGIGGVLLAIVTGWLGGELVDRLGVGVDNGAHLNAPSSLIDRRTRPGLAFAETERRAVSLPRSV